MDEPSQLGIGGISILVIVAATVAYVALRPATQDESTLARALRTGVLRIGYANEAPYGYLDGTTGNVTGEAPEVAKAILKRMGIDRVEAVITEFGSLIPGLQAGRFDMIAAGMYITPDRCREVAFSNPTYVIGEAFVVPQGNPLGLHSYEDVMNNPKARLGLVGGAVQHRYAKALGISPNQIVVFPDNPSGMAGLASDRIDAFAATTLTVGSLLAKWGDDNLEQAHPFRDPIIDGKPVRGYGAFGFRKRDAEFVQLVNQHLANFLGSDEHLNLVRPFGFTTDTLPRGVTADELCH